MAKWIGRVKELSLQQILVVDDDESISDYLRRGLTYEGYGVRTAATGEEALSLAREQTPDLVILDWMLPGVSGLEVLKRLKAADQSLPVMMLTAKDAPADQVQGLETGADDYVVKPVRFEVLVARIRARLRSREPAPSSVLHYADLRLDSLSHRVFRAEREVQLTAQEFKLLQLFMEAPERVYSKQVILDRVWGSDFFGESNVVEVYMMQLRQKIEAPSQPRLLHTIRGVGYVLRRSAD